MGMICFRELLNAPPRRTVTAARSSARHTPGSRTDDRYPRASADCRRARRARSARRSGGACSDRHGGHPAGPRGRPGRDPRPRRPVRRAQPHLRARMAGLPRQSCSVLGGLADLRPGRGRDLHRAVGLLAGPRRGALWVAVQVARDVRAPTGLADPAAVLGRARIQSGHDLVCARPARLGGAQREVRRRVRLARARRLLPGQPQPGVLVDRHRGPALRPAAVAAADRPAGKCSRDGGLGGGHRRDHRRAGAPCRAAEHRPGQVHPRPRGAVRRRPAGRRDRHGRRAHPIKALGRLRAGRRSAGHRVDGGQGLHVVEPQSVLARPGLGSGDRLLPHRDRHLAPAARRPFP